MDKGVTMLGMLVLGGVYTGLWLVEEWSGLQGHGRTREVPQSGSYVLQVSDAM